MGTVFTIIIVYLIYFIFTISKYDKSGHYKNNKELKEKLNKAKGKGKDKIVKELKELDYQKLPSEVKFFVNSYKIDLEKVNIRGLLKLSGMILAFSIAVALIVILIALKNQEVTISIFVGFIITMVLYLIGLKIVGTYFKKKGLTKDE